MTACVICNRDIDPAPRYFTHDGEPRHMLCDEPCNHHRRSLLGQCLDCHKLPYEITWEENNA